MHSSSMRTVRCSGRLVGMVSAWGCLPRDSLPRGVCSGCVCRWGGGDYPPLWTEFLTHPCENITLPQQYCI